MGTVPKGTPFNGVNLKEKKRFSKKIPKERLAVFFVEIKNHHACNGFGPH